MGEPGRRLQVVKNESRKAFVWLRLMENPSCCHYRVASMGRPRCVPFSNNIPKHITHTQSHTHTSTMQGREDWGEAYTRLSSGKEPVGESILLQGDLERELLQRTGNCEQRE